MSLSKRRIGRRALGVVVGASLLVLGLEAPAFAAHTITGISPTSGPATTATASGCVVVITGTGFDQPGAFDIDVVAFTGAGAISGAPADFHVVSDTEIWTTVPATAETGAITVTDTDATPDDIATSAVFTVTTLPDQGTCGPTIASFTPTCGVVGTVVTITGTNLLVSSGDDVAPATDPEGGAVRFNPYLADAPQPPGAAESPTTLAVNVPAGALDGPIRVTTGVGTVNSATSFDVAAAATDCPLGGPLKHPRSITLKLVKHLIAKGRVTSTEDPAVAECFAGVPVKIQRRKAGSWKTVGSTTTNDAGKYKRAIKDKPGKYRALAPAVTLADDSVCAKARSARVRHRH